MDRLSVNRVAPLLVVVSLLGCEAVERKTLAPSAPTADAFVPVGRVVDATPAIVGDVAPPADDAGAPWQPPLRLTFEPVEHEAETLRATDLVFLPDAPGEFLWLDKDGDVHLMRLEGARATRVGGFRVLDTWNDSDAGLISLALDPDFARNQRFYIGLTTSMERSVVRAYTLDRAALERTPESAWDVIGVEGAGARRSWHNVGSIGFDEAGVLWALFGDKTLGAPARDPDSPLGALLRVVPDPTAPTGHTYPDDNAYAPGEGHPGVYAKGLRSPWRGLYHAGRYFFGDVGQDKFEEVNVVDAPGLDFAWPHVEGPCVEACDGLTDPFIAYDRSGDHPFVRDDPDRIAVRLRTVHVGLIYRPDPDGRADPYEGRWNDVLTFGDASTGFIRAVRIDAGVEPNPTSWPVGHLQYVTGWAQAPDGYVYLTGLGTWPIDAPRTSRSPLWRAVLAR